MQKETFEVEYEYEGERLDKYVSILFPEQSRSFFQKLIKDGNVSVNDKVQKANYRLKTEDLVTVEIPDAVETQILPEDIPLVILSEDDVIDVEIGRFKQDEEQEVDASFDGRHPVNLNEGDKIRIIRSDKATKIMKLSKVSFLDTLQKKMRVV